jgi:uncharacterized protein
VSILNQILSELEQENLPRVKELLKDHPYIFNFEDRYGWPVAHRCLADPVNYPCFDLELARLYVASGANVNRRTDSGLSLLFLASMNFKGAAIAEYFVSSGARMSSFEEAVLAIYRGQDSRKVTTILKRLLKKEPELARQVGPGGRGLLHYAARRYMPPVVRLLLDSGANPNLLTFEDRSPLGLSGGVVDEKLEMRKLLISRGANFTPVEQVVEFFFDGKDEEAIQILEREPKLVNAWYSPGTMLQAAVWFAQKAKCPRYLLEHGADANTPNEMGQTALHRLMSRTGCAEPGDETAEIFHLLVKAGADINYKDERGYAPLHMAAGHAMHEVARLLVENGADVNATTNEGQTPLDILLRQRHLGSEEIVRLLKRKGATRGSSKR